MLKLWIPDTIVYEEATEPYWLYSDPSGYVYRTENFQERTIVTKFGNQFAMSDLCAIVK